MHTEAPRQIERGGARRASIVARVAAASLALVATGNVLSGSAFAADAKVPHATTKPEKAKPHLHPIIAESDKVTKGIVAEIKDLSKHHNPDVEIRRAVDPQGNELLIYIAYLQGRDIKGSVAYDTLVAITYAHVVDKSKKGLPISTRILFAAPTHHFTFDESAQNTITLGRGFLPSETSYLTIEDSKGVAIADMSVDSSLSTTNNDYATIARYYEQFGLLAEVLMSGVANAANSGTPRLTQ